LTTVVAIGGVLRPHRNYAVGDALPFACHNALKMPAAGIERG